jgi:hypothetical protein
MADECEACGGAAMNPGLVGEVLQDLVANAVKKP